MSDRVADWAEVHAADEDYRRGLRALQREVQGPLDIIREARKWRWHALGLGEYDPSKVRPEFITLCTRCGSTAHQAYNSRDGDIFVCDNDDCGAKG